MTGVSAMSNRVAVSVEPFRGGCCFVADRGGGDRLRGRSVASERGARIAWGHFAREVGIGRREYFYVRDRGKPMVCDGIACVQMRLAL